MAKYDGKVAIIDKDISYGGTVLDIKNDMDLSNEVVSNYLNDFKPVNNGDNISVGNIIKVQTVSLDGLNNNFYVVLRKESREYKVRFLAHSFDGETIICCLNEDSTELDKCHVLKSETETVFHRLTQVCLISDIDLSRLYEEIETKDIIASSI